jgi:hypothetical protein
MSSSFGHAPLSAAKLPLLDYDVTLAQALRAGIVARLVDLIDHHWPSVAYCFWRVVAQSRAARVVLLALDHGTGEEATARVAKMSAGPGSFLTSFVLHRLCFDSGLASKHDLRRLCRAVYLNRAVVATDDCPFETHEDARDQLDIFLSDAKLVRFIPLFYTFDLCARALPPDVAREIFFPPSANLSAVATLPLPLEVRMTAARVRHMTPGEYKSLKLMVEHHCPEKLHLLKACTRAAKAEAKACNTGFLPLSWEQGIESAGGIEPLFQRCRARDDTMTREEFFYQLVGAGRLDLAASFFKVSRAVEPDAVIQPDSLLARVSLCKQFYRSECVDAFEEIHEYVRFGPGPKKFLDPSAVVTQRALATGITSFLDVPWKKVVAASAVLFLGGHGSVEAQDAWLSRAIRSWCDGTPTQDIFKDLLQQGHYRALRVWFATFSADVYPL